MDKHPEKTCEICGGPNVVWFAANDLWNQVMAYAPIGVVCPVCFVKRAEEIGLNDKAWELRQELDIELVAADILYHIDSMYPKMWDGAPKTARMSLRNTIILKLR